MLGGGGGGGGEKGVREKKEPGKTNPLINLINYSEVWKLKYQKVAPKKKKDSELYIKPVIKL